MKLRVSGDWRERKRATGQVREREEAARRRGRYPRRGVGRDVARRPVKQAGRILAGEERKGRKKKRQFSGKPPGFLRFLAFKSFSIKKQREKQEFEGLFEKIKLWKFDIWNP